MCVCLCVYLSVYVCVFEYVCSSMSLFIDQQMGRWDLSLGRSILRRAGARFPFSCLLVVCWPTCSLADLSLIVSE